MCMSVFVKQWHEKKLKHKKYIFAFNNKNHKPSIRLKTLLTHRWIIFQILVSNISPSDVSPEPSASSTDSELDKRWNKQTMKSRWPRKRFTCIILFADTVRADSVAIVTISELHKVSLNLKAQTSEGKLMDSSQFKPQSTIFHFS